MRNFTEIWEKFGEFDGKTHLGGAARLHSVRSGAARAFRRRDAPWGRLSVRTAPAAPLGVDGEQPCIGP